uniref:VQ domain-containing protein n=1 Tax=Oryza meridionalis TaxID=40149 RepID=A0A0E0ERK0_9ORYZ
MDSGNSGGSLQSSSGGDDEFDSRGGGGGGGVDSSPLSALLRPSSSSGFSLHGGSMYGFQELGSVGTSLQHQQGVQLQPWSAAQFAAGAPSSSSPRVAADSGVTGAHQQQQQQQGDPSSEGAGAGAVAAAPARGSRKRTRASRRAPTTVLTTDTSNFRAMVQEFTGIPSPPFVAGVGAPAASLRTRFDHLFPSPASALRSAAGGGDPASSLPPYLLRPFAQKLPTAASPFPPYTSSSSPSPLSTSTPSSSNLAAANANATTTSTAAATTATSVNPTAAGAGDTFQLTPAALLRMQHDATSSSGSYLSFPSVLAAASQPMFGGFAQGGGGARLHDASPSPSFSEFLGVGGGISLTDGGGLMSSDALHHHLPTRNDAHHHGGDELSGVVASGSCKLNYTSHAGAPSSSQAAAAADKPPDGSTAAARPARGEGLDPWICTSE